MNPQFKRILKQISSLKSGIPQKESYSSEDVANLLSQFQTKLESSFVAVTETHDQKFSQTKNLLKKTNKAFTEYKIASEQKHLEITKQNDDLRRQLERSKKKVHELLKISEKYQEARPTNEEKSVFEKGTQCQMKDQEMERIIEDREKQNILLKQRISELQNQIKDHKQDVEAASVLIKQLVRQLETNMADRETWYGTGSSNASERDSLDRIGESDESFESEAEEALSEKLDEEISQVASVCRHEGEDCSTIDGSNTTNKDYALPQWLQFGQATPNETEWREEEEEELKMWPELIWNRLMQLIGKSLEI